MPPRWPAGSPSTRNPGSSAGTGPAPTLTEPAAALRTRSRSRIGSTCGRTLRPRSSGASPGTRAACPNPPPHRSTSSPSWLSCRSLAARWRNVAASTTSWCTPCWPRVPGFGRLPDTWAGGGHTVQRYARAATWQELVVGQKPRPSRLDPFTPHLLRRISEGCLKATTLHREVTAQGFTGGYGIVRAFVEHHRTRPDLAKVVKPPSVRQVTGWICRH